jgi:hypothetical protein
MSILARDTFSCIGPITCSIAEALFLRPDRRNQRHHIFAFGQRNARPDGCFHHSHSGFGVKTRKPTHGASTILDHQSSIPARLWWSGHYQRWHRSSVCSIRREGPVGKQPRKQLSLTRARKRRDAARYVHRRNRRERCACRYELCIHNRSDRSREVVPYRPARNRNVGQGTHQRSPWNKSL